jgi:hypothetical protein
MKGKASREKGWEEAGRNVDGSDGVGREGGGVAGRDPFNPSNLS